MSRTFHRSGHVITISVALLAVALRGAVAQRSNTTVVDITAGEFAIAAPDSVRGSVVTLRLTQVGDARKPWPGDSAKRHSDPTYDFHMVWLVRLDSGRTVADLYDAERNRLPTAWATIVGGVGFAVPPRSANATMRVAPGNYALVCFVGSAREDRTRYHLLKGMFRSLVVVGAVEGQRLPTPTLTVVIREDTLDLPGELAAGRYVIALRNDGQKAADLRIQKLEPGRTVADARAWRPRLMTAPPGRAVGGVVAIPSRGTLFTEVELDAGEYLFNDHPVIVRHP